MDHIVDIQIGMALRPAKTGEPIIFFNPGDFDEYGRLLSMEPPTRLSPVSDIMERARIRPDDILLMGKGSRHSAIFYREKYPRAVASAAFYILRVNEPDVVLPEFLACYLNQPGTQTLLDRRVSSSATVPTLNKKDLLDLPIPIPSMDTQRRLINLYNTFLTIQGLHQQITDHHQNLITECFSTTLSPLLPRETA
ncbi:restriction endonuclease subunit S [Telluribacter humicola]|uniref:restriction endonuclease subunit S n=1 Tax=Telluribacter humicola TaxID=1720261 RepID=UPI001A96CC20|nr:restriction endonuclease subunit S [Telluribacter humicola]